jgi:soluble lytic murein transglycosylase
MRPAALLAPASAALLVLSAAVSPAPAQQAVFAPDRLTTALIPGTVLGPTDHPRLPLTMAHLWLAPDLARPSGASASLASGLKALDDASVEEAVGILSRASNEPGVLAPYGLLGLARAQLRLGRADEAVRTLRQLEGRQAVGFVREAAALVEGEALESLADDRTALAVYERLSGEKPAALDEVLMRVGRTAEREGEPAKAFGAYARVYYEMPLSAHAVLAKARLDVLQVTPTAEQSADRRRQALGRAQRLFDARMYGPARAAFAAVAPLSAGDEADLIRLRLSECDYQLKRPADARTALGPLTERGPHQAEALYYYGLSTRALGNREAYIQTMRRVADGFPDQPWAQEALNDLATRHIRADEDGQADEVLRELLARYPRGRFSERAAWKVGWRAFNAGRHDETAELFDRAAAHFPRSDYRPSWLFWSGRAHALAGRSQVAEARFALTATDYLNSYYGRLAVERLNGRTPPPRVVAQAAGPIVPPPSNGQVVRALLEIRRYEDALNEVRYAQRQWGDSSTLQATISWIYRQQGLAASGREQFTLLRGSITQMRRAYPQFIAAGGELLPRDVLSLIFPVSYWDLILKHAAARGLDPYLVAALVAQESTFVPDVRSSANAVGLMQLIPSTARTYARKLGLRYSSRLVRDPEANIRMGTAYLADKMQEFGSLHLALASYNAGERAVRRWLAARPGHPADEFIDDIPYPETQNYVKRILGTQEDYRRLYGSERTTAGQSPAPGAAEPASGESLSGPNAGESASRVQAPPPSPAPSAARPRGTTRKPARKAATGLKSSTRKRTGQRR